MEDSAGRVRRQALGSLALIIVVLLTRHTVNQGFWLGMAYLAFYLGWLWLPERLHSGRNDLILAAVAVSGLLVATRNPEWQPVTIMMLYPCAGLLARRVVPGTWLGITGLGLMAVRYMLAPADTVSTLVNMVSVGGVYAGFYAGRIRREARDLDRRRVQEIKTAYDELHSTHQQLVETSQAMAEARAREERLQIAADIHDGVGHRLTSLVIGLESMEMMLPDDVDAAERRLPNLVTTARQALMEVRQAVHASQGDDGEMKRDGFDQLLEDAARDGDWSLTVEWRADPESWSPALRVTLFRVLQESLTNTLRHAHATQVAVRIVDGDGQVALQVSDDGVLIGAVLPGFGLNQMQKRCQALGGTLTWSVSRPHGLTIAACLPWKGEHDDPGLHCG